MKHIKLFESFFKSTNESKDNSKTAVIALFNPEGKLLALKRGITAPWKPGHWNITGGMVGDFIKNELPLNAALREVKEETGLNINPKFLFYDDEICSELKPTILPKAV